MIHSLEAPLYQAAISTFEELGFMLPSRELTPAQSAAPPEAAATVRFDGPVAGALTIYLFGGVLAALAANMLGSDDAPEPALQRDALGELANVICGTVLPAVGGADADFHLAAPRVTDSAETSFDAALALSESSMARAVLAMDDGRAEIHLFVARTTPIPLEVAS